MNLDQKVFEWIFSLSHRSVILDTFLVFSAEQMPYLLALGAFFFIFRESEWRQRLFLFGELALALILSRGILTHVIRFFYDHPRPFDALGVEALIAESGRSFPSGHAAFFFALATILFLWDRKWGMWFFLFALVNGVMRIAVGVHWPLDIVGGAVVGIGSAILVHTLIAPQRKDLKYATAPVTQEA